MSPLPPPNGPWPVSTLTLELPVARPRSFLPDRYFRPFANRNSSNHGSGNTNDTRPAFHLRTVAVTLYYPAASSQSSTASPPASKSGPTWLPDPRMRSLAGLLKYASFSSWWAYLAFFPAWWLGLWGARLATSQGAQLAAQPSRAPWPTAVFSPGLAGTATTYSVYCSHVASHGVIVAALHHRDGTSPSTVVHLPGPKGGKEEIVYTPEKEVTHPQQSNDSAGTSKWLFRRAQLAMRRAEVYEAEQLLRRLNAGQGDRLLQESTRSIEVPRAAKLAQWQHQLDLGGTEDANTRLIGLGHSFGAATILSSLDTSLAPVEGLPEDAQGRDARPRIKYGILLDPWIEPLADPVSSTQQQQHATGPIYVVNSQGFTLWSSHFQHLRKVCEHFYRRAGQKSALGSAQTRHGGRNGNRNGSGQDKTSKSASAQDVWLTTLTGTSHTDFSDFPFVLPKFFDRGKPKGKGANNNKHKDNQRGEGGDDEDEDDHPVEASPRSFMNVFVELTRRVIFATSSPASPDVRMQWENSKDGGGSDLKSLPRGLLIRHALGLQRDEAGGDPWTGM